MSLGERGCNPCVPQRCRSAVRQMALHAIRFQIRTHAKLQRCNRIIQRRQMSESLGLDLRIRREESLGRQPRELVRLFAVNLDWTIELMCSESKDEPGFFIVASAALVPAWIAPDLCAKNASVT